MGEAYISNSRSLILTSTKNLQDQYHDQFRNAIDIRGQQNYSCLALQPGGEHYAPYIEAGATVAEGPCHFGEGCSLLLGGCTYYDRVRSARQKRVVLSNYDLHLSMTRYTEGLGTFDFLACDEAHEVPEKLASAMSAEVSEWEAKNLLRTALPAFEDPVKWAAWANTQSYKITRVLDSYKASGPEYYPKIKVLNNIKRTLDQMACADETWIAELDSKGKIKVEPVWPKQFVEPYLFNEAKKIVFSSATIRPKTLGLLGIEDYDFFEYPSPFPVASRPVWYVPKVQMKYGMSYEDEQKWVRTVDQIIAQRLDRKIVIHTVSYARQKFLLAHSIFARFMLANTKDDTAKVIQQFKESPVPCILVSPSADTGVDFPGIECETIIVIKVPFPDTSSKIYKARMAEDAEYGPYVAAQTLIQMAGRGMRSENDRCETIIIDSAFGWLKRDYSHLFPNWFLTSVVKSDTLPHPLEKL
jgi:Rad3-related DNA helicase